MAIKINFKVVIIIMIIDVVNDVRACAVYTMTKVKYSTIIIIISYTNTGDKLPMLQKP